MLVALPSLLLQKSKSKTTPPLFLRLAHSPYFVKINVSSVVDHYLLRGENMSAGSQSQMRKKCKYCGTKVDFDWWNLCPACNSLAEQGKIVLTRKGWKEILPGETVESDMIYCKKAHILTATERPYYQVIQSVLPAGLFLFPQVALSSVIKRSDEHKFQNELSRVFDFLVTDSNFTPLVAIEINDPSHNSFNRKQRDKDLEGICGEAGLPLIFHDTKYGENADYFRRKITNALYPAEPLERTPYIHKIIDSPIPAAPPSPAPAPVAQPPFYTPFPPPRPKKKRNAATILLILLLVFLGLAYFIFCICLLSSMLGSRI